MNNKGSDLPLKEDFIMELKKLINEIDNKVVGGRYINISYQNKVSRDKLAKGFKDENIFKSVNGVFRLAIKYGNMKRNLDKEIQPVKYGQWVEGYENVILEYNGKYYLRVYLSENPHHKINSTYTWNGSQYCKQELIDNGVLRDTKTSFENGLFNINIDSIVSIG